MIDERSSNTFSLNNTIRIHPTCIIAGTFFNNRIVGSGRKIRNLYLIAMLQENLISAGHRTDAYTITCSCKLTGKGITVRILQSQRKSKGLICITTISGYFLGNHQTSCFRKGRNPAIDEFLTVIVLCLAVHLSFFILGNGNLHLQDMRIIFHQRIVSVRNLFLNCVVVDSRLFEGQFKLYIAFSIVYLTVLVTLSFFCRLRKKERVSAFCQFCTFQCLMNGEAHHVIGTVDKGCHRAVFLVDCALRVGRRSQRVRMGLR